MDKFSQKILTNKSYDMLMSLLLLLLPLLFSLHTLYFAAILRCLNAFNRLRFD